MLVIFHTKEFHMNALYRDFRAFGIGAALDLPEDAPGKTKVLLLLDWLRLDHGDRIPTTREVETVVSTIKDIGRDNPEDIEAAGKVLSNITSGMSIDASPNS